MLIWRAPDNWMIGTSVVTNRLGNSAFLPCIVWILCIAGCSAGEHPTRAPNDGMNVVIALVDTLRADHMSCYGYSRSTTPHIDEFSERAILFERARSQASCTFPSVNSLLTSRFGAFFLFQPNGYMGVPEGTKSLAEILEESGYRTAAFSASPIVRSSPSRENPDGGYGRGFNVFDESCLFREAECINQQATRWLEDVTEPFFLYLHYMDPHDPYKTPRGYRNVYAGEFEGPIFIRDGNPNPIADMVYGDGSDVVVSRRDIDHLLDLYDDEIRYFDGEFASLLRSLEERGVLDHTVIVLASDHGEEFMEHGDHIKHCRVLFDTSTRVPLIVRIPGINGRRISTAVQNLDLVPTLLDYLNIDFPGEGFSGASLRDLIQAQQPTRRVAFSDQGIWRSVDDGRFKLLLDAANLEAQLFDLRTDPLELNNLYQGEHPAFQELEPALAGWLERTEGGVGQIEALTAGKNTEERLRALGYLQ
jgi:arylsulfatase